MSPRRRSPAAGGVPPEVARLLSAALREDRFDRDRTSRSVVPARLRASGSVTAQAAGVLSGVGAAAELARRAGRVARPRRADGARLRPGMEVLELEGSARRLLAAERPLLNLLMHLSGVATATARAVRIARGRLEIRGTRKTLPGLRELEKRAIRHGGGVPHRRDLSDGILVKNNHLALVDLGTAMAGLRRARALPGPIEVEARDRAGALRALAAGAQEILLDNLPPGAARRTVRALRRSPGGRRIPIELSGGITEANLDAYARTGADSASLGSLTHSAPALPFHLTLRPSVGRRARPSR